MEPINQIIVPLGSLAIMILAIMSIALSYGRFYPGEVKTVLGWVLIVLYLLVGVYGGIIVRDAELFPQFEWEINYILHFSMMVVALFLIRAAWNLYKFSKVFGFKDVKIIKEIYEILIEAIIKAVNDIEGHAAIRHANKVKGLQVSGDGSVKSMSGNRIEIVKNLVEKYKESFGSKALEAGRKAAKPIIDKDAKLKKEFKFLYH